MYRRVTADEVAQAAGVSRSAVSRTFTPGASVAPETRKKIIEAADQLGYRRNALAASLTTSSSNLVGIVAGDLTNFYDSEVIGQLVRALTGIGKWPVLVDGPNDGGDGEDLLEVLTYPLDAMVVRAGSVSLETAQSCLKLGVPLVFSGRVLEVDGADSVCCDNNLGAQMAVQELAQKGRRKIGFIGGAKALSSDQERFAGFKKALNVFGLQPAATVWADFSFQGGYRAALDVLNTADRPDALFCCNDAMALGALNAARNTLGLRVPEDLSIIGFDDIEMAAWPCFNLTTIRAPIAPKVDVIMEFLLRRFSQPNASSMVRRIDPVLVRRETH